MIHTLGKPYIANPLKGHRQMIDIPPFRRPPVGKKEQDK